MGRIYSCLACFDEQLVECLHLFRNEPKFPEQFEVCPDPFMPKISPTHWSRATCYILKWLLAWTRNYISKKCRPVCFAFQRAGAPRNFLIGKGHPMRKLYIFTGAFQGHQGNYQGPSRQLPLLPRWISGLQMEFWTPLIPTNQLSLYTTLVDVIGVPLSNLHT